MIGRIYAIALNTFREASRKRLIYAIVLAAIGLDLFALVLGQMSLNEEARVVRDVGLGGISLFGCITAIVLGVSLLYTEIQRRTIHTILSKPLERHEFVIGKYLGMAFTLTLVVAVFTLAMMGLLYLQAVPVSAAVMKAVVLSYVEVLVVAAIAVFFSAVSSPFLSGLFSFGLFFLGRVTPEMRAALDGKVSEWIQSLTEAALYVVPDLHLFAVSGSTVNGEHVSVHGDFVGWGYVGTATAYGLLYMTILLILAAVIMSRRDFS